LVLARELHNARITAVDLFPEFLEVLEDRAREAGVSGSIETLAGSMDSLPLPAEAFDLIWSEGAIYNMGFREGISAWRRFLRPGGILAVSEITWLQPDPPEEIRRHWESEYPQIGTASEKIAVLEREGFDLVGYTVLSPTAWIDAYYRPTAERVPAFLERHRGGSEAAEIVALEREEADLYGRYRDWFSYGFYITRKR
jgi:SAM-dependent methyltransferase